MTSAKPSPYGRGKAAKLREAVHKRLLAHQAAGVVPTSNRFILYELRQRSGPLYGHKSRGQGRSDDQNLSDASKWLRDKGLVPWAWIVDETRRKTEYLYTKTVAEFVVGSLDRARIDCWDGEPPPLILCESRTFGGVMERTVAGEYLCPVAATNGQVGGFLHTNIAPLLEDGDRAVLYIGDHDKRGYQIEANTRRILKEVCGPLDWTRVALTAQQVRRHRLPVVQKHDRVLGTHQAVEVEALGQSEVTALIRAALDDLLPEPLEDVQVHEDRQRERVRELLDGIDFEEEQR
jgi:hypothetical protein